MSAEQINLDQNATTPLDPRVGRGMADCDAAGYANPASQHAQGRRARQRLEAARESIGSHLGARLDCEGADQLIFTSGGTESNNLAILGLAQARADVLRPGRPTVVVSSIEHPSVAAAAQELGRRGWSVRVVPATRRGTIEPDALAAQLTDDVCLVSIMLGNNETGVLQDVAALAKVAAARDIAFHTDAVQVVGKLPVDFRALGVAAMSATAHKLHGPRGIGVLLLRCGVSLVPQGFGGFQQGGLRPGTESVTLAVGFQAALDCFAEEALARAERMTRLRDRFESAIERSWSPLVVHGRAAPRLPHTSCLAFPGFDRQALAIALDLEGVACSTGSACASGATEPSATLVAMGCPREELVSSLRFSLGAQTIDGDVDEAAARVLRVLARIRDRQEGMNAS